MVRFFASPQTLEIIKDQTHQKVIFIGGFGGYWNFGDLVQLRGVLRWYQRHRANDILCPLHELTTISGPPRLGDLRRLFEANHWLFYSNQDSDESHEYASTFGLQPLNLADFRAPAMLHVCGGGFLNGMWGRYMLRLIEYVTDVVPLKRYVISGQQVGQEFVNELAAHCLQCCPDLVGGRDEQSVKLLQAIGIPAKMSGDDELDELLSYCDEGGPSFPPLERTDTFGMHLNTSNYVLHNGNGGKGANGQDPLQTLDRCFQLLVERFGRDSIPVVVNVYSDQRDELQDTWSSLKKTSFSNYFSIWRGIDLIGLFTQGRMAEAVASLKDLSRFVATSYHTALFLQVLRVPTFLLVFNDYYQQKRIGLGEASGSLSEFLSADPQRIISKQNEYLLHQQELHQIWWESLDQLLNGEPGTSGFRKGAGRLTLSVDKTLAAVTADRDRLREELRHAHRVAADARRELEEFRRSRLLRRVKAWQAGSVYGQLRAPVLSGYALMNRVRNFASAWRVSK